MRRQLLVIDLEATCWIKGDPAIGPMETIEIGALLVDPDEPAAPREFQSFVKPARTSVLSAFCRELTGIAQSDVDAAEPFAAVLERFCAWLGDPAAPRFASWGGYDKNQLLRDCERNGVPYPFAADHFNVKRFWSREFKGKPAGMAGALARMGLELEGEHHRGLDDARNIWRILQAQTRGDLSGIL